MFHLLQPKYRSCDRCHGLQYLDAVDDCWVCLQCAQRDYTLTEDEMNERVFIVLENQDPKKEIPEECPNCVDGKCQCEAEVEEEKEC